MQEEGIITVQELSKRLSLSNSTLAGWFDSEELRKKFKSLGPRLNELSSSTIRETKHLPENNEKNS